MTDTPRTGEVKGDPIRALLDALIICDPIPGTDELRAKLQECYVLLWNRRAQVEREVRAELKKSLDDYLDRDQAMIEANIRAELTAPMKCGHPMACQVNLGPIYANQGLDGDVMQCTVCATIAALKHHKQTVALRAALASPDRTMR